MPGQRRTRFIKDRYIKSRDGSDYVKAKAFEPGLGRGPHSSRWELSTFRLDELEDDDVWKLGFDHYLPSGRKLRGRADLTTRFFIGLGFTYVPQPPPDVHGSFVGWPAEQFERLDLMAQLAEEAIPVRHPLGEDSPVKP